ncbi:hypothetical protein ACROYT_G021209 [Oculina patagonica]
MAAESADSRALKLVVFGGTGGTGKEVVTQALEQGYLVTAVVRTPGKVEKRHPNLELVKGVVASIFNPTTFYSESMFAILEGMKR